jgi:hypothetical protein
MSGDIQISIQNNLWENIGKDLVGKHMTKDVVSNAYKSAFQTITTKGKNKLRDITPVHSGWLQAAAGKKVDRFPDKLGIYGLVGYLFPKINVHQFFYVKGTKKQRQIKGKGRPVMVAENVFRSMKNRGKMPEAKPNPFELVKASVDEAAKSLTVKRITKIKDNAEKNMNNKYGNAWRDL